LEMNLMVDVPWDNEPDGFLIRRLLAEVLLLP